MSWVLGALATELNMVLFTLVDAKEGPDSRDSRLRRVALSIVKIDGLDPFVADVSITWPCAGFPQTFPRGKLQALELRLRFTTAYVIFVSDSEEVVSGWWQNKWLSPRGKLADLWRPTRCSDRTLVLQVPSHLTPSQIDRRPVVGWMITCSDVAPRNCG